MANKKGRRRFGWVRKLPSGRFQASYLGPDGQRRYAPDTFESKTAADQHLVKVESLIMAGEWTDPARAKIKLTDYAERWIKERPGLRPRTVELYRWLLAKHITPHIGGMELGKLSTAVVRQWRITLLDGGASTSIAAKSYRLLRAVMNTAVEEDRILPRNPCRVRGADQESPAERPVLTVAQVFDLAGRMPKRWRALILMTAFATLRWGEVTALRRRDVAPDGSWVRVTVAYSEVPGQGLLLGPPKSRAGVRTLAIPEAIRPEVIKHLMTWVKAGEDALLFTGERGNAIRKSNFAQRVKWTELVTKMGLKGVHFHDLRACGQHLGGSSRVEHQGPDGSDGS